MAFIRHSAKWGVAVGVRPLRRHEKQPYAGGLIPTYISLRPYPNHNSIQTKAKNACVCQLALSGSKLEPDLRLRQGYSVGRNGAHSPLRQSVAVGVRLLKTIIS